ncbi:MAG: Tat pathway signal sequence domain protein 19, partial [Rubritepida sp.]|nr:Tat pathway signal sequence domain protein 19 [Rubritepida sp.]
MTPLRLHLLIGCVLGLVLSASAALAQTAPAAPAQAAPAALAPAAPAPTDPATPPPPDEREPIRLLVGLPPGSGVDRISRVFAEALSQRLFRPVNVENRTGARGNVAGEEL